MRHVLAFPNPYFNPLIAFVFYVSEIKRDIETHQYIPGIFPQLSLSFQKVTQHSTHHFARLEPYGFGIKLDQPDTSEEFKAGWRGLPEELKNSVALDEALTGFEWDNPRYRKYLDLVKRYQS